MPKPNKKNVIKTSLILDKDFSTLQAELFTCSQISIERIEGGGFSYTRFIGSKEGRLSNNIYSLQKKKLNRPFKKKIYTKMSLY